ncbi:10745_t:CDS:2 [Paraglomus occultum]|uniref:10745_t:CDS:1 n=1 Tax=Paraglomus occultum TaxID=144539 RepID=A0A9N8VQ32_9GLOM|nr:10745_t:CDS:2 [Paraglomus occultum]
MPRRQGGFRFQAKKIFLTYPRCAMEKEDVLKELSLKIDYSVGGPISEERPVKVDLKDGLMFITLQTATRRLRVE